MSPLRSLAAIATIAFTFVMTGCTAETAPDPTDAPTTAREQGEEEEATASMDEMPAVDTNGTAPAKKRDVARK